MPALNIIEAADLDATGASIDRVVSIEAWSTLAGFSYATGRREIAAGRGPRTIKLSPKRRGIRLSEHFRWLNERAD